MKQARLIVVALVSIIGSACTGAGFEDDPGDSEDQAGEGELVSGDFFALSVPTSDSCGIAATSTIDLSDVAVKVSKDGKTLEYSEDGNPITCKAGAGGSYACTMASPPLELPDTDITFTTKIQLEQDSAAHLGGSFDVAVACKGAGCGQFASGFPNGLPCSSKGDYALIRAMPEKFVPVAGNYDASVGKPLLTTCDVAPPVAANQKLRIEVSGEGTANVFSDDDPSTPHECEFAGRGHTVCTRLTVRDGIKSAATVDAAWTTARTFEGIAEVELSCFSGADCSGSKLGQLPCTALYHVKGTSTATN